MPLILSGTNGISSSASNWAIQPDDSGRVRIPNQPAFAVLGTNSGNYTSGSIFQFDNSGSSQVNFNIGSVWNSANDRFTAPIAGRYLFMFGIYIQNSTSTYQAIAPCVNGSQLSGQDTFIMFDGGVTNAGSTDNQVKGTFIMTLAANDFVDLRVRSGANTLSVYAGHSYFQGCLIG